MASRGWISNIPTGWTGRDYIRAVQLCTNNLPCRGLPYKPPALLKCRAGCDRVESFSHILQGCPVTHFERIKRHNDIVEKVARHIRTKKWSCEVEPRVRHSDGQLFIPDLVIHKPETNITIVCDVLVSWEGPRSLTESWTAKQLVYDHNKFREAANRCWPGKTITVCPLVLGARGIWPRANEQTADALGISQSLKNSCVHSCFKWASTLHRVYMSSVWRKRPPDQPSVNVNSTTQGPMPSV